MADMSQERQLLEQLVSEKRTLRINAVVQLAKTAVSNEALKALEQFADGSDRELSFFAAQAVSRIRSRRGDAVADGAEALSAGLGPDITRSRLLSPQRAEIEPLLSRIRSDPAAIPEELQPPAAAFLGRYGREDDASYLTHWLGDGQSGLIIPVIEAIEALAPHALMAHFPMLLASNHPIVRIRAIAALRKVDEQEAEAHLSELLASRKSEERIAGLSAAFAFPFPRIREYVLSILAEEQDPEVLHGCETLLASNPEVDTALRVLDLIDTVPKPQAARLSAIFKEIAISAAAAGLIAGPDAPHEAILKLWRRERLRKFLADLEIQIAVASAARRESIEDWLAKNIQTPDVAAFVERLSLNPATEDVYRRLADFLPHAVTQQPTKQEATPSTLPEREKLEFLSRLHAATWDKHAPWVRDEARFGSPSVRALALRNLTKLSKDAEDLPLAESALQQDEPEVQLAAFILLESRSPERLVPRLPDLLALPDPKIRGKAVRFALKWDERKAVESIEKMLRSPDKTIRAQAVSCLILVPFDKIGNLLLRALEAEDHPAIARRLIVVLLTNPSKELLERLDKIQASSSPGVTMLIAQARMDMFDTLLRLGVDMQQPATPDVRPAPKREAVSQEAGPSEKPQPAIDQPMQREIPKPYAVSEVRQAIRNRQAELRAQQSTSQAKDGGLAGLAKRVPVSLAAAVAVILLALLPILLPRSTEPPVPEATRKASSKSGRSQDERREEEKVDRLTGIPSEFRMGRPCRLTGRVLKTIDKKTFTFTSDSRQYRCAAPASLPMLLDGEQVVIEMLPYRTLPNGMIAADVLKIASAKE
ncbi:HEAT repeat domain-containing protein [Candidatus Ozemobacteraceae bacterium]|nr:HEAT repeat domain-containing protein [Candidatus Ozemobacteraceae bacterium]